jgi:hypothetical protein
VHRAKSGDSAYSLRTSDTKEFEEGNTFVCNKALTPGARNYFITMQAADHLQKVYVSFVSLFAYRLCLR